MPPLLAEWATPPRGVSFSCRLAAVAVSEQVGTLAAIAQGRFILQCGIGDGAEQFDAMGANLKHRPSAFEEGLDAVRRLLAGETVRSHGRYHVDNARIAPRPPGPVDGWIGATAEPAVDRAARLGDAWLASRGSSRARPALAAFTWSAAAHNGRARARGDPPRHLCRESGRVEATAGPVWPGVRGSIRALVTGPSTSRPGFRDLGAM